jgi:hypothetical protein
MDEDIEAIKIVPLSTEAGVPLMHQPVDPHGIKQMVATW